MTAVRTMACVASAAVVIIGLALVPYALPALAIGAVAFVGIAIGRHIDATDRTGRRICRMIDACQPGEYLQFTPESVYEEIHAAYWLGRAPRLDGVAAVLWARTGGVS